MSSFVNLLMRIAQKNMLMISLEVSREKEIEKGLKRMDPESHTVSLEEMIFLHVKENALSNVIIL